jgi:hypothetical protein
VVRRLVDGAAAAAATTSNTAQPLRLAGPAAPRGATRQVRHRSVERRVRRLQMECLSRVAFETLSPHNMLW